VDRLPACELANIAPTGSLTQVGEHVAGELGSAASLATKPRSTSCGARFRLPSSPAAHPHHWVNASCSTDDNCTVAVIDRTSGSIRRCCAFAGYYTLFNDRFVIGLSRLVITASSAKSNPRCPLNLEFALGKAPTCHNGDGHQE
jgi:hypothetical protein